MHINQSPLAGKTVKIVDGVTDPAQGMVVSGAMYRVEDWWDRLTGGSWMLAQGNPAAIHYAIRTGIANNVPIDDEVLYGKIGGLGHLVHISEIEFEDSNE